MNRKANAPSFINIAGVRILALDLSVSKTGAAWGGAGELPKGTALLVAPKGLSEGGKLAFLSHEIQRLAQARGCKLVIFAEFVQSAFMLSLRANAGLRGAVMARLADAGIETQAIYEISARSSAGVNMTRPRGEVLKPGWMKQRARSWLVEKGIGFLSEDEGDAAILLYGCKRALEEASVSNVKLKGKSFIRVSKKQASAKTSKPTYDLSDFI